MSTNGVRRLHASWAIALAVTLATVVGILILTRDLAETESSFRVGVEEAGKVDATTDDALNGADQLPPANNAINGGIPEVVGIVGELNTANKTLGVLGTQLGSLAQALDEADPSLVSITGSAETATSEADNAAESVGSIPATLGAADGKIHELAGKLDETQRLADAIDSKLRIALLLPDIPRP